MMNDITREDAVKWLTNLRDDCGRHQDMWHYAEALDQIIELLSTDVAPVVRCKDCKYWGSDWALPNCGDDVHYCDLCDKRKHEAGFCDEGERRSDELQEDDGRCQVSCAERT